MLLRVPFGGVCDDRPGGNSSRCRSVIEDARLVRDLKPAEDLTEGDAHAFERATNGRMKWLGRLG